MIPFSKLDVLHRRNLERILPRFKVSGLDEPTMAHLNRAWHRLDGWPDATAGLQRLHKKFLIAPVSNGNISLMAGIARRNDFPWDAILGAEIAGDYKPKPRVYLRAAEAFDCEPDECMMVAAHSGDLAAAAATGLKTAHVARPNEHGPGKGETGPTVPVDIAVTSSRNWPRSSAHDHGSKRLTAIVIRIASRLAALRYVRADEAEED